jgi:hypothetical protein
VTFVLFTETQATRLLRDLAEHEAAILHGGTRSGPELWPWVSFLTQELGLGEFTHDARGLVDLAAALQEMRL